MNPGIKLILFLIYFFPTLISAQANVQRGFIITASGQKVEVLIKSPFRLKGKLTVLSLDKKEKIYAAGYVKSFSIDSVNYISYSNDFYKEIFSGTNAVLYKKVTSNREEKIYNGVEVVGFVETTDGNVGDYYLRLPGRIQLDLITRKNFKEYFIKLLNTNDSLITKIRDGSIEYAEIGRLVKLYNN